MTQSVKNRSRSSSSNQPSPPRQLTLSASPSSATGATSASRPEPDAEQPAPSPVMPALPPLPFLHSSRRPSFAPPRQVQRTAIRQASPRSMRGGVRGGR